VSAGVLVVGFGRRGRDWHETVRSRRGCHAVAVVDPDPAARAEAEQLGLR
jgi:predicted dehydrogenase